MADSRIRYLRYTTIDQILPQRGRNARLQRRKKIWLSDFSMSFGRKLRRRSISLLYKPPHQGGEGQKAGSMACGWDHSSPISQGKGATGIGLNPGWGNSKGCKNNEPECDCKGKLSNRKTRDLGLWCHFLHRWLGALSVSNEEWKAGKQRAVVPAFFSNYSRPIRPCRGSIYNATMVFAKHYGSTSRILMSIGRKGICSASWGLWWSRNYPCSWASLRARNAIRNSSETSFLVDLQKGSGRLGLTSKRSSANGGEFSRKFGLKSIGLYAQRCLLGTWRAKILGPSSKRSSNKPLIEYFFEKEIHGSLRFGLWKVLRA